MAVGRPPTGIDLSSGRVAENRPAGTAVGALAVAGPVDGPPTYELVGGAGDADNASFAVVGDQLRTAAAFDYEAKASYSVRVRATDSGGLWVEQAFAVTVTDVPDLVGFDVQRGEAQRSFINHVGVTADRPGLAAALLGRGRARLVRRDLAGNNPAAVKLSAGSLAASGSTLTLAFGPKGLSADGYYTLELDLDGDGAFEAGRSFYRLRGDTDGDRTVGPGDLARVREVLAARGYAADADVNGDGRVDRADLNATFRAVGRSLAPGLPLDD